MNKNLLRDIIRAFRTHKWEETETGILIGSNLPIGGVMTTAFRAGPSFKERGPDALAHHNMVVTTGLIKCLAVLIANGTKVAQWYLAPYKNNVAPQLTWTAANATANFGEFTNYDEATRPALIYPAEGSISTPTVENDDTAITTIGGGADKTLWGGFIISVQAKSATTGTLLGGVQFAAARSGLQTGDELAWTYALTAGNSA